MKVLHIDSSILGDNSASRVLSREIVAGLTATHPGAEVKYVDLAAAALPHMSGRSLARLDADESAQSAQVLDDFLAADVIVIGAPMYNFTIPSQLKAWIDRILVAGKTFKYGDKGAEGLAGSKRVIVAISRGGFYGADMPTAAGEHLETYLRWVFGFIGITNPEFILADGIQVGPDHREKALAGALQAATSLHAA